MNDFNELFNGAVLDVTDHPEPHNLAHRLRRVDRCRKTSATIVGVAAILACSVAAAAAWPEDQQPLQLRLGERPAEPVEVAPPESLNNESAASRRIRVAVDVEATSTVRESAIDDHYLDLEFELPEGLHLPALPEPTPEPEHQAPPPKKSPSPPKTEQKQPPADEEAAAEPTPDSGSSGQTGTFTAVSAYGSCEEPTPYDIYSGSADAGATVTITSPYSATANVTADSEGHWSIQVTFAAAPVGEPFTVTASSGGQSVGLGFVRTG